MRRQHSTAALVYRTLYPTPTPSDPPDFPQHLIRHLITEVRIETQRFYGGLDTIEAKYPGLNYSYGPHRKRLSQFQHHARLFMAFDQLGLTAYEIGELCKWEGTLWARQRYERDEGIKVLDTTGNDIRPYQRGVRSSSGRKRTGRSIKVKTDIEVEIVNVRAPLRLPSVVLRRQHQIDMPQRDGERMDIDTLEGPSESSSDFSSGLGSETEDTEVEEHAGVALEQHQRLITDPAYDAYMKEDAESSALRRPSVTMLTPQRQTFS